MESEQKCENGSTSVRELHSQVTMVSWESPSARGNNRSIKALLETAQKWPERRAISHLYACSSNPPNYHDEHNSPSPPINAAVLECTKCEPAGVHEKKCGIFQPTGSVLLNDCSVATSLVRVSHSGFVKFGEVVCDSVRTEESDVTGDGYDQEHVRYPGSLQYIPSDNSKYEGSLASSGNSESIFRSYVISQEVSSKEAVTECIPICGNNRSKDLRPCEEETFSVIHLGNSYKYERCGSNYCDNVNSHLQCDCCSCSVSRELSDPTTKPDRQTKTVSTRHVCHVDGLCSTLVSQPGLSTGEILPSRESGTESSVSAEPACHQALQCTCYSTKNSDSKFCQLNKSSHASSINEENDASVLGSTTSTRCPIPPREAGRSDQSTSPGSCEKLYEPQDSGDSASPCLQCPVEPCNGGELNHCCVRSKDDDWFDSPTVNSCVGDLENEFDNGCTLYSVEVDRNVESTDDLLIQLKRKQDAKCEQEDAGRLLLSEHVETTVGCTNEVDTLPINTPETILATSEGKSLELVSSFHVGTNQRLVSSELEFISPVFNLNKADSPSGDNILQTNKRIEVSPGVRKGLIQISKSLQKKQSRIRTVNEVKTVTHKKRTDTRSKSIVESRKCGSNNSKENSRSAKVEWGRHKKLNDSHSSIILTSTHVNRTPVQKIRESSAVALKSSPRTSNSKCKLHSVDNKPCPFTCRFAGCVPLGNKYSEQSKDRGDTRDNSAGSVQQRSNVLTCQKRKVVVRQTRASILRCTGQQLKFPDSTLSDDIQRSLFDSSAVKELRDTSLFADSSSTGKFTTDKTQRSIKNVNRLVIQKTPVPVKIMANAGFISKRQALVKCQSGLEKQQAGKVRKEVKAGAVGVGHVVNKANMADPHVTLKDGRRAAVKTDVAKVSPRLRESQSSKTSRQLNSGAEVSARLEGLHLEKKSTDDSRCKGRTSLARLRPLAPAPRKAITNASPSAKKKLNISDSTSSVQAQSPLLSSTEGADVTLQCSTDKTLPSLSGSATIDNRCEAAVTSDMDNQPCTRPSSSLKKLVSVPLFTKPATVQSFQGTSKRQLPHPPTAKNSRPKTSIQSSSLSSGGQSSSGLSPNQKQSSKESTLPLSSVSSRIKTPSSRQSNDARIYSFTPLVQSGKNMQPLNLPESTKHQHKGARESKPTNIRYKSLESNGTNICKDVPHPTETTQIDQCHNKVAEAAYSLQGSRDRSTTCSVHTSIPLTQQHNKSIRGNIPRYSKTLIKDACKYDTLKEQKESVLKSILINTSDRRLKGQAELLDVAFHKPMKEEGENALLYSGDCGGGQETHSLPDTINSSNIQYESGSGVCDGALELTELHREEVLELMETDKMAGDSDPTQNRTLEVNEVTAGEGHRVQMLGKTRQTVALTSKKTVKENENMQVRKQSPNLLVKQRKISVSVGHQLISSNSDTRDAAKAGISKKAPTNYLLNGSKNHHSISAAGQMNHSQTVQTRAPCVKPIVRNKLKSEQNAGAKMIQESAKRLKKAVPKLTTVTRTQPSFKSRARESRLPGKPQVPMKPVTLTMETSVGSCSESTASVLSELSSSSSSFLSCEQTTPETEDDKSSLCINKTVNHDIYCKLSHALGYQSRHPTATSAVSGGNNVVKSSRASSNVSKNKIQYTNIAAIKGNKDKNVQSFRHKPESGEREITQQKYVKNLDGNTKKGKWKCETDMKVLMNNEKSELNRRTQLVDGPVLSKIPVFNGLNNKVAEEKSHESVTKYDSVLMKTKECILPDTLISAVLGKEEADIRGNNSTYIQEMQLVKEECVSTESGAAAKTENGIHEITQTATFVGLHEFHAGKSSEAHEPPLVVVFVQPAKVPGTDSTTDVLSSLPGSCVSCLEDTRHQVPALLHLPPIDQTDESQKAAEAGECKQGVSRDTPIGGESAGELNASDIDSRERARSASAQRKEAGSEEKEKKVEETQTAISYKRRQKDSGLHCFLPSDIQYCDSCNCALYPQSMVTTSNTTSDKVEKPNQLVQDFSTNDIHSHKDICEFRCLDITQNTSSVSKLDFESARYELGYELLMDHSSDAIHSRLCCHCVLNQKNIGAMTTSVPGTFINWGVSSVFGFSVQDPEEHRGVSSIDSSGNMEVNQASDEIMTGLHILQKSYQHKPKQPVVNVEVSSSDDQVSENVNDVTNVANDFCHMELVSKSLATSSFSNNFEDVHTKSSHISEPVHKCQLADPLIVSITGDVNSDTDDDVRKASGTSKEMFESDASRTVPRELSADIELSIPTLYNTPYGPSSRKDAHAIANDVIEHDVVQQMDVIEHDVVQQMDVSLYKSSNDTVSSLLDTDESFYSTPIGHSFQQNTRNEEYSKNYESIFSPTNDDDTPEYMDDPDDKNYTESYGSSDSSYHSATSDILTSTDSTPERELASSEECEIRASCDELHTFISLDSKCAPGDSFLDASRTPLQQHDSDKEFNSLSFIVDSVKSDEISVTSKPSGYNLSKQSSETSLGKTSQFSDVASTGDTCSVDTSVVSQTLNNACPMSSCSETIAKVGMYSEEVGMNQNRDTSLKESIAQPTSLTEKCGNVQEPNDDSSLQRHTFREQRSDSCSVLESLSKPCDIPVAEYDLLSSLTCDNSSRDLVNGDTVPGLNTVYACSNASSFSEFSSLTFSSNPQKAAETRYRQRKNSEDKMPSFLSMRSLSVERKKSVKNKSKALPRSRSSSTVISSTAIQSIVTSPPVTASNVTSPPVTASNVTPSTLSSPAVPSSITPPSTLAPSTLTSPIMVSSIKASSTVESLIMTTSTIISSTAMSCTIMPHIRTMSPVINSCLYEPQFHNHEQSEKQQQQQRQSNIISHSHQVNHSQSQEPTNESHIAESNNILLPGLSECSIHANLQYLPSDTDNSASDTHRRTIKPVENRPEKYEVFNGIRHVNTRSSNDSNKLQKTPNNLQSSRPNSIFKPKDKKVEENSNKSTNSNTSQSCRRSDNQEQHNRQSYRANEPDSLVMQNRNSSTSEKHRKSSAHGEHINQSNLTSPKHHVTDSDFSHKLAPDTDRESYLRENKEHPVMSMKNRYNFINNSNRGVAEGTLPVSECISTEVSADLASESTSTEFSYDSSIDTPVFKTSLFESGYSSDIKSPEVKSPGKWFVDTHRQTVYGNHRQLVQTVSDSITLNSDKGNKITISGSLSLGADLKCSIQSKTREETLLRNSIDTDCKHSLEDLLPLSGEKVEKLGCETARRGEISHFIHEHYGKVREGGARDEISRGGDLEDLPHELSTLCRDNVYILGKSVTEVNRQNIAPDLDSKNSSNSSSNADFPSVSNSVNDTNSTYQEQHSKRAHNESFVNAEPQLQKHAATSMNAFSDTIATSERLKLDMATEYTHTSNRGDVSYLGKVPSKIHTSWPNLISSENITEIHKQPGILDIKVSRNVNCNLLKAKNSCSEYSYCGCRIGNYDIHKQQRCTCASTQQFSAHMSINPLDNPDGDNDNVYSHVTMSKQRTSDAPVSVSFKNLNTDIMRDSSSDSPNIGCKSDSVTDISTAQETLNSFIIKDSKTSELEHLAHDQGNKLTYKRLTATKHACVDCVYSGDNVGVRRGFDVNRDSFKEVHACTCRADVAGSSLECSDGDIVSNNLQPANVCDHNVRSLCPDIEIKQSKDPDSMDTSTNSDHVKHGGSLQHDLYIIHYQAHIPLPGITDLPISMSINQNQELVEEISITNTDSVSLVTLPGPIENDEAVYNMGEEITHVGSTGSCLSPCNQLEFDMPKKTHSCGDYTRDIPDVVYDIVIGVSDHPRQQTGETLPVEFCKENIRHTETDINITSDKKQTSVPGLNDNVGMYKDVSMNANYGNRARGASSNTSQCENNNSLLIGQTEGPLASTPSLSLLDLDTRSRHDKSGLQTSIRRSPTNRCEILPKETSPFILKKVCELLSKASANEPRNFIRPKSPLPHNDISRVTLSKNRSVTPDSRARARAERVIKKWRSVLEKSKAVRKEKSIAVTFLNPSDNRSQLPPQISPTSLRAYKWERGDTGIWMKVYLRDEDNRDSQLVEQTDNGKECPELDRRQTFTHDPIASKGAACSGNNSSAHSNKPKNKEADITLLETFHASTTAANYSNIKISHQSNDLCLQLSEPLNIPEITDMGRETMIPSSTRSPKSEDHQEANNKLVEQKEEDIIDNEITFLMSKYSGAKENNVVASIPEIKTISNKCDTETTGLIPHSGKLHGNIDIRTDTKPAVEAADKLKRAEGLEQMTRKHFWPTVTESLKRFQKSRATVPSWEHFKRGQSQGHLDAHWKHKTSNTESNKKNTAFREEQTDDISDVSSGNKINCNFSKDTEGNCLQPDRTLLASGKESHIVRDTKVATLVDNISHSLLKEPPSTSSDSKISTARNALSISVTGKCARPQTLGSSGQTCAKHHDSLRMEEKSIQSSWTAPSASERTLPPSPIITLPSDAITTRHSPQQISPLITPPADVDNPCISEFVSISTSVTDHAELSSSSDADSATPVVKTVSPSKLARNNSVPLCVQTEQTKKQLQQNIASIPQHGYSQQNFLHHESFQITEQSSVTVGSSCARESQATSVVTTNTEMTAATAMQAEPPGEETAQPGTRRHGPSTKLISVSVWDTHDGDKSLRNSRRLWASEDKHTLAEISETEEAHTAHENINGKTSDSQSEDSDLLQINDGCVERVRASRSPVRPQAKQKPCQRRSLSLPSGGLSYGDVKVLYKDGHFVLVDTSADRASKVAGETSGGLDDVFEEAEGTDQFVNGYPHESNSGGYIQSKTYSDSRADDAVKTKHDSLSFDSCDTGLSMRRCGFGGSIFYSLPRRKVRSQNSKSSEDAKMWRSQQSLMSQTEINRMRQKEEEETADMCRLGPGLRRNNSFTEAMGSTVILTDRNTKMNHKVRKPIPVDTLDGDNNSYNSCQKEVVDDLHYRKSRSKSPGFIQRMLQKRKGTSSLSLSMSSLKPQNNDVSSSSLSLASSISSTSLQHTSPGISDSRDSSIGRKISFRGFFKRKNSADWSTKKNASSESCSSPPLAAFLSNDDIGAAVPSAHTHTHSKRATRHGSFIGSDVICARESESYYSYQRPRSSSTHVSASSSQCSVYRSRSHDESNRSPIADHTDSASRRARSESERICRNARILSEEQLFSGESFSEFDLSSPDPHNSDGTLTPRSTSPCATDLSGDQTLLASPILSQKTSHTEHHVTSNPSRNRRTRCRDEKIFQRTLSAHGDSSLTIIKQRPDNGEIISSNSNDSGIQKDFSVNSSAESIQAATVNLRGSHSPSPTSERPKSDSTVRWADWVEHSSQPWSVQHFEETDKQHKLPRATSETVEDFNDNGSETERNEDGVDKRNEVEESSEGGIYSSEHRRNALLNARSLGNITNAQFTARTIRSASCCSTGSNASDIRMLMHSRESLMNLVELRRPVRDATSAKLAKLRRLSTPQPITVRTERPRVRPARAPHVPAVLMHAHSMPDNLDKLTRKKNYFSLIDCDSQSITSQQSICDNSSDESEYSMDYLAEKSLSTRSSHVMLAAIDQMLGQENLTLAEALWDHVTMDPDELAFRAGDLISVSDGSDKHWWFGVLDGNEGWFPATFVRLRVNQDVLEEDLAFLLANDDSMIISEQMMMSEHPGKTVPSTGYQGMQQARANVVNEIINAEREYVKHLHDVIEGYAKQARKRPEMFPIEKVTIIFSNIEDIYLFATELLADLDKSVIPEQPHLSELGHCFLDKVRKFEMYSDYCNNHSAACEELRELYRNKRYRHFFEACRLLQEMIEIPLEGFLLTPVQKICKYHLQLAELLKFTAPDHPDFNQVQAALEAMKKIAMLINERKRKMESVEKLAAWQLLVDGWEGPDILDDSSELIYSGELNKINHAGWSQERYFFLFDHQLIYCKKDLLKKAGFCFKGRINMDTCEVINVADGREPQYNVTVRNAWKLRGSQSDKWYLLVAKTTVAKQRWLKAFQDERKRVKDDTENNFNIPYHVKQAVITNFKQKNTIQKPKGKGHLSRANTAEVISSINRVNAIATLPRTKNRHKVKSEGALDTGKKMKWFFFGKGKT